MDKFVLVLNRLSARFCFEFVLALNRLFVTFARTSEPLVCLLGPSEGLRYPHQFSEVVKGSTKGS
jgi:hypothetical protein